MKTIALDVYGTLIDIKGLQIKLKLMLNEGATELLSLWRSKQLEYSFRRGLMEDYVSLNKITHEALHDSLISLGISLSATQQQEELIAYNKLPAFQDVIPGIIKLKKEGYALFAFSNGSYNDVHQLLTNANLFNSIDGIVSVDSVKTFKPSPKVYQHFEKEIKCEPEDIVLISSNPFDLIGAANVGWNTIWINRQKDTVFDCWGVKPSQVGASLIDVNLVTLTV